MELKIQPLLSLLLLLVLDLALGQQQKKNDVGHWTDWTDWSECSTSCGSGTIQRSRIWIQPPGQKPLDTPFTMTDHNSCHTLECPVDGAWNMWASWSQCSQVCGVGVSRRTRMCRTPYNGGKECEGEDFEEEECNKVPCPPLPPHFNLSSCTSKHSMCTSGKMCIPMEEMCDDVIQCHDGSDEKRCYSTGGSVGYAHVKGAGSRFTSSFSLLCGLVTMAISSSFGCR